MAIEANNQIMKFKVTNDKLKMEITLKDLVWLFHNSPNNIEDDKLFAKVIPGKRKEFAEWVVSMMNSGSPDNEENPVWGQLLEEIFNIIFEGYDPCDEFINIADDY